MASLICVSVEFSSRFMVDKIFFSLSWFSLELKISYSWLRACVDKNDVIY